jgi:hypothetical protein
MVWVSRAWRATGLLVVSLLGATAARGQESGVPGLDFLEYLGSWQGGDEEWVAIVDWPGPEAQARERKDVSAEPPQNAEGEESNEDQAGN